MPTNLLTNIVHLSSPYLDLTDDAYIGSGSSTGTGAQPYPGQLGAIMTLSEAEANKRGSVLTLHSGLYQYVQFKAASSASNAAGQVMFWSTRASYIVTPDATAPLTGSIAGIALNAVTKGNYGWIQIGGVANVKFKASLTAATPAIGDLVIVDQTPANLADVPTQSGNPTYLILKGVLGTAVIAIPAASTVSLVELIPRFVNQ
jgi:hypothetical protein